LGGICNSESSQQKGAAMLVKVFIKRQVQEGKETAFLSLLKKIRLDAMKYDGYISGETLISTDDPQKVMIISTWQNIKDWEIWKASEERKNTDALLEELQVEPTSYEPYVFSKYWLSVQKGFPESLG
jgi:heme-degrading monooxygenase HmoA